jgi:hypothetical protein
MPTYEKIKTLTAAVGTEAYVRVPIRNCRVWALRTAGFGLSLETRFTPWEVLSEHRNDPDAIDKVLVPVNVRYAIPPYVKVLHFDSAVGKTRLVFDTRDNPLFKILEEEV